MISLDCPDSCGVEYHCKCKKCGEEADVDAFMVLTSYPPQYNYSCPHCGERGYVLCAEAYTCQAKNAKSVWEDIKPNYVFQGGDVLNYTSSDLAIDNVLFGAATGATAIDLTNDAEAAALELLNNKSLLTSILEDAMEERITCLNQSFDTAADLKKFNKVYKVYKSICPQSENANLYRGVFESYNRKSEDE